MAAEPISAPEALGRFAAEVAALLEQVNTVSNLCTKLQENGESLRDSVEDQALESRDPSPHVLAIADSVTTAVRKGNKLLQGIEDACGRAARGLTVLRRHHQGVREEIRQIKVMSNPQVHVPSRRTKIFAHPLKPEVSFEQLRQMARSKLRDDKRRPGGTASGAGSGAAAASRSGRRKRGPAKPSAAAVRGRRQKRQRKGEVGEAQELAELQTVAAATVAASVAVKTASEKDAPMHPLRTRAEQDAKLRQVLTEAMVSSAKAGAAPALAEVDELDDDLDEVDADLQPM